MTQDYALEAIEAWEAACQDAEPEALIEAGNDLMRLMSHYANAGQGDAAWPKAGEHAAQLEGLPSLIDRVRQLCATPFDILEIEGDDGTITDTPVVRATDVLAALNGSRSDS